MKNYAERKDKYYSKFADAMESTFRTLKYGIAPCCKTTDFDLIYMRYELAKWQSSGDYSSLSEIKSNYKRWMPVQLCADDMCYININVNDFEKVAKSYHISPAQSVWLITHDLGFNPNVTTTNDAGEEIVGLVEYLSDNTLQITFSEAVSGWAYLS